jgi:hypothetical protein
MTAQKTRSFKMKHGKLLTGFMVLFCASALFLACPTDPEEDPNYGGEAKTISAISVAAGETKYYSLSTDEEVAADKANTTEWDIAFTRTRLILTNSGDTASALGSGGDGGVWYIDKEKFDDVSREDKPEDTEYNTDTNKYVWTGMGAAPTAQTPLNVMSFVGYTYGNGETASVPALKGGPPYDPERDGAYPSTGAFTGYKYDQKTYYKQEHGSGGGPTFSSTNYVYIIRHGDGKHYSKIQITYAYQSSPAADTFVIKYSNF